MIEILWIGRGGQGAFTAAKLLGAAYVQNAGKHYSLAFPTFGPERRGAPMKAFTKLDERPILDRSEIEKADYIVILDETLYSESLYDSLKSDGKIIMNSKKHSTSEIITFDADTLAGSMNKRCTNTIMLGVLLKHSQFVSINKLETAIADYFPPAIQQINIAILRKILTARKERGLNSNDD